MNLDENYNEDLRELEHQLVPRLTGEKSRGLFLLHGQPGTGKTTYIKSVFDRTERQIIYMPPYQVDFLSSPNFIDLLAEEPNSILIIEDAEAVLVNKGSQRLSATSNLLNISDGLLGELVDLTIIATFNTDIASIDPALLRKGRLTMMYEFKKLDTEKANRLLAGLGSARVATEPMSLANIYNEAETGVSEKKEKIGF